jgi:hypothetical protein
MKFHTGRMELMRTPPFNNSSLFLKIDNLWYGPYGEPYGSYGTPYALIRPLLLWAIRPVCPAYGRMPFTFPFFPQNLASANFHTRGSYGQYEPHTGPLFFLNNYHHLALFPYGSYHSHTARMASAKNLNTWGEGHTVRMPSHTGRMPPVRIFIIFLGFYMKPIADFSHLPGFFTHPLWLPTSQSSKLQL